MSIDYSKGITRKYSTTQCKEPDMAIKEIKNRKHRSENINSKK